jgi:Protein of unknown function (DUF3501)
MNDTVSTRKLTLDDIADTRAYERQRDDIRARVLQIKARRRLHLGTVVSVMFENRETIRYQIQEMARVEGLKTDAEIQEELDIYNPVIPDPGQLTATLFIELVTDEQMREWLPKLVGIERSLVFRLPDGTEVRSQAEAGHASQLTREHVTAAVHYITFEFTPEQVAAFADGTQLVADHPDYVEAVELLPATIAELRTDLLP